MGWAWFQLGENVLRAQRFISGAHKTNALTHLLVLVSSCCSMPLMMKNGSIDSSSWWRSWMHGEREPGLQVISWPLGLFHRSCYLHGGPRDVVLPGVALPKGPQMSAELRVEKVQLVCFRGGAKQ